MGSQRDLLAGCTLALGSRPDLLILGRKAELHALEREALKSSLSQIAEHPHSGGCVVG